MNIFSHLIEVRNNNLTWLRVLLFSYKLQIKCLVSDKKPQSASWCWTIRIKSSFFAGSGKEQAWSQLDFGIYTIPSKINSCRHVEETPGGSRPPLQRVRVKYLVIWYWIVTGFEQFIVSNIKCRGVFLSVLVISTCRCGLSWIEQGAQTTANVQRCRKECLLGSQIE